MSKSYQKEYRENMPDEQKQVIEINKEKLISDIGVI